MPVTILPYSFILMDRFQNINKELYGEEKLLEMLSDNASSDVRTTVNVVVDSIASHVKEAEASDDLTILLIQYEPGTANS